MAVVVRRGIYLDLDKTKLLPGELCITTDTGQCFFCYAPGNVKELATKKDLQEILTESPEAYNALQKLLEDLENNKDELTNILNDILSLKENKLDVTGDSCNNTVTFEEANNDEDIVSGETHAKIFGKILKSFKALRQGKINTTNIVQTDAVNEQTKVPSSAVTYAHGQLISQLQSNITALNNKLTVQTVDLSTILTVENPKHTIQYAQAMKYGNIVTLTVRLATSDKFSNNEVQTFTLPNGYRPLIPVRVPCMLHNNPVGNPAFGYTDIGYCAVEPNGAFAIRNYTGSTANYAIVSVTYIAT